MVPPALVQTMLPGGATALVLTLPSARFQAVLPACLLALQFRCLPSSLKQCCPLPRGSRSGGATRTRLAVPPARATLFPCSSGSALRTCSDGASHASNVASRASVSLHFWGYPHSSRCRFLAVLPALVQTILPVGATRTCSDAAIYASPSGAARMSFGTAIPLSAKFFETMRGSRSGGATRTRPPFPCSSCSALRTCPDGASHASNVASLASVSLQPLALLLAGALTVSHTRHDVASPASVSVHSIASIVEPALGGRPTLALLRTLSQAEFTSPSPSWRLMED